MKQITTIVILVVSLLLNACTKTHLQLSPTPVITTLIDTPKFSNVLIVGNSITFTAVQPGTEWLGNWGMAATVADSDYVHHLTKMFKALNPNCVVTIGSSTNWEYNYDILGDTYVSTFFASLRAIKPDLVILRLGEDVVQSPLDTADFGKHYRQLVQEFSGQGSILLGVGSLWQRPVTDDVMKRNTPNFITLSTLGTDASIYSFGAWSDPGIELHPRDLGHRLIADTIWTTVQKLRLQIKK